jgi:LacI family transcriptional regulator
VRAFVVRQRLFGVVMPPSVSEDERVIDLLQANCRLPLCPHRLGVAGRAGPAMVVTHDHLRRGRGGASRLADLGHTRVGLRARVPATLPLVAPCGAGGFREGLAERGVPLGAAYEIERAPIPSSPGWRPAHAPAGDADSPPTAIFTLNDDMAIGVMQAARERGLELPRDLSLVGFDDLPMASRVWPNLTSVRLPIRDMGRMAAEKLLAPMRGLGPGETGPAGSQTLACGAQVGHSGDLTRRKGRIKKRRRPARSPAFSVQASARKPQAGSSTGAVTRTPLM